MTQLLNRPRTRLAALATTALLLAGGSAAALAQPAAADRSHDDRVVRVASGDDHRSRHAEPGDDRRAGDRHHARHHRHHARHHARHGSHVEPGDDHGRHGSHVEPGDDHGRHGGHGADD
jgi:hypothetical protein